jgi:cation transport ATPase
VAQFAFDNTYARELEGFYVPWKAAAVALFPSAVRAAGLPPHLYFETAVIVIALITLGRWLEARARGQTSMAIRMLMGLQPRTARVLREDGERVAQGAALQRRTLAGARRQDAAKQNQDRD